MVYSSSNDTSQRIKWNFQHIVKRRFKLIVETVIGAFLGITLGFFIDVIFKEPSADEKPGQTIGWIILQVFVDALIVWWIVYLVSEYLNRFDQDEYEGMVGYLIFGILFFLVQTQLLARLNKLYSDFTGHKLPDFYII